ncbi:MAG TPA: cytochrome c-type biogenesis protein CcmH [Silvibacterium sp.]|nr:cytochrome c-type biogenesis protein CcmH [Silvibacterium sp.]
MRAFSRASRIAVSSVAVCLMAILAMGSSYSAARYSDLGHKMICMCGCNYILLECNHVNCPSSGPMVAELRGDLNQGMGDYAILHAFEDKYGATVLAAPMFTRFNMIAWILPPLLLLLGIAGTFVLVRRWRRRAAAMPPIEHSVGFHAMREKIRRETQL